MSEERKVNLNEILQRFDKTLSKTIQKKGERKNNTKQKQQIFGAQSKTKGIMKEGIRDWGREWEIEGV